jgi:hypothetical protein
MADEIKKEDKLGKIIEFLNEKGVFKKIKLINKELIENGEKEIVDSGLTTNVLENIILYKTKNNAEIIGTIFQYGLELVAEETRKIILDDNGGMKC